MLRCDIDFTNLGITEPYFWELETEPRTLTLPENMGVRACWRTSSDAEWSEWTERTS